MNAAFSLPRLPLGTYPTPFVKLEKISAAYGRNIYLKRDDLCGVALGGNKVRKLEYLLSQAKADGCDTVFTTGGAQSNHAMLTAACAAHLNMHAVLLLKHRGVTRRLGNLILNDLYGAEVHFMDTDRYDDIYDEMHRLGAELEAQGHKCCYIPVGGSTPLGALGYAECVREIAEQSAAMGAEVAHIVSATGSGGTTAGLLFGARLYMPGVKVTGMGVDDDDFDTIVRQLVAGEEALTGLSPAAFEADFEMIYNVGDGYAVPNAADTPYIEELARTECVLLDPVYTGKAWSGMLQALARGAFGDTGDIVFVHTGGTAALFAMDLG